MAKLIYAPLASLDWYIADANGNFDWAEPDDEVHASLNEIARAVGTYLLGRRMYEVLAVWDTIQDERPVIADYAEKWRSTDKIVYSSPIVVGDGISAFPPGSSVELTLEDERWFSNGTVYLRYRTGR